MNFKTEDVTFPGFYGEKLAGRIDIPEKVLAYAVFAHCFTGTKDFKGTVNICKALASRGIAVLRFDFHGLGDSAGEFGEATFTTNVNDIICAAQFLEAKGTPPTILIGHSLGGTATLVASHQLENIKIVSTIGSPFDPSHAEHLFEHYIEDIYYRGEAMIDIKGRRFRMEGKFLDDLQQQNPQVVVETLGKSLIILHSPDDELVEYENAEKMFKFAKEPKKLVQLSGEDHLVRDEKNAEVIGEEILKGLA